MSIVVRFWGVRGSIACPSSDHIRYGGNTSCVQIEAGGHHFIFDAGTGLRGLGQELAKKNGNDYSMKNLAVITLAGSNPNIKIPEEVQKMIDEKGIKVFQ